MGSVNRTVVDSDEQRRRAIRLEQNMGGKPESFVASRTTWTSRDWSAITWKAPATKVRSYTSTRACSRTRKKNALR